MFSNQKHTTPLHVKDENKSEFIIVPYQYSVYLPIPVNHGKDHPSHSSGKVALPALYPSQKLVLSMDYGFLGNMDQDAVVGGFFFGNLRHLSHQEVGCASGLSTLFFFFESCLPIKEKGRQFIKSVNQTDIRILRPDSSGGCAFPGELLRPQ